MVSGCANGTRGRCRWPRPRRAHDSGPPARSPVRRRSLRAREPSSSRPCRSDHANLPIDVGHGKASTSDRTARSLQERQKTTRYVAPGGGRSPTFRRCSSRMDGDTRSFVIVWELMLLGVIVYVPWFHAPFGTFSFSVADWLLVIAPLERLLREQRRLLHATEACDCQTPEDCGRVTSAPMRRGRDRTTRLEDERTMTSLLAYVGAAIGEIAGCFIFSGMAAPRQIAVVARAGAGLLGDIRVSPDTGRCACRRTRVCRVWWDLHRGIAGLALDRQGDATGSLGCPRGHRLSDRRSHHPVRAKAGGLLNRRAHRCARDALTIRGRSSGQSALWLPGERVRRVRERVLR